MGGSEVETIRSLLLAVAAAAAGWYALRLAGALLLLAIARRRPALRASALRLTPGLLRPLVGRALLGGLIATGAVAPGAWAEPGCPTGVEDRLLDRGDVCGTPAQPPPEQPAAAKSVTVSTGDSLWTITADLLGTTASAADVAQGWPELWRTNRALIGPDPGLIQPGQTLTVPASLDGLSR